MKTLKSLTLFTALVILSACSASGNDGKNNGSNGGGDSDAFLAAIGKYSKLVVSGSSETLDILDKGKIFQGGADIGEMKFTFIGSTSATEAKYKNTMPGDPETRTAIVTILGTGNIMISNAFIGSEAGGNKGEFKPQ